MKRKADIARNLLPATATIGEAMRRLDEGVGGIVFLVDGHQAVQGAATDGDIRRALLSGHTLSSGIATVMNRRFTAGRADADPTENLRLLSDKIRHVPILDSAGRLVDLLSWADLWRLPLVQPSLGGNEAKYVNDCITTGWISSQGAYVERFQSAFAHFVGHDAALCTSSGTTALHLALMALGVGPGDEVIVPDLTFGATANVVVHAGASPVFVDIDPVTWTMDPAAVRQAVTPRTKAIIPVHLYGHPCDMNPIMDVARKYGLRVIEDCAEALGATYNGRQVGTLGDVGCYSFFANKVITTGEGGMVVTADKALLERMAVLRDHGMSKERRYWHLFPGYNYRMTNLQAALGLAQMEKIGDFLQRRRDLAQRYAARLKSCDGIQHPAEAPWARNIYWLYSILVDKDRLGIDRDQLAKRLADEGIETRNVFYALHAQPAFTSGRALPCPVSEDVAARGLSLPMGNDMTVADVDRVCDAVISVLHTRAVFQTGAA